MKKLSTIISSFFRHYQSGSYKKYTTGEINGLCQELNMNVLELINSLLDIILKLYNQSCTWGGKVTTVQKLKMILEQNEEDKDIFKASSKIDFNSLARDLGISTQKLSGLLLVLLLKSYEENAELLSNISELKDKVFVLNVEHQTLLQNSLSGKRQSELVKHGVKPARKSHVNIQTIEKLSSLGYNDEEIAIHLGVSRSTIWRRKQEAAKQQTQMKENGEKFY